MSNLDGPVDAHGHHLSFDQKKWRMKILLSTYVAYVGYYMTRKAFTICKTTIAADFGWHLSATGQIWTAFLVAYMIGQFVNSFVGRKWGPRLLLLGGLGISIIINVIFGFANSFPTFVVFMFFNGLVQASGWPGSVGGVAHWLRPSERGGIMGVWSTSYVIGNMMVKSVGGFLLGAYGWNWSFWGLTVLSFLVWWVIYFWQRNKPEDVGLEPIVEEGTTENHTVKASQEDHVSFKEYIRLAFNPVILTMGVSYLCIKFLRYALDSWLPAFLNLKGLDVAQASYYSQIFDFAGLAGMIVAGFVLDRIFRGNWAFLCFLMGIGMIIGYIAVIEYGHSPVVLACCFGLVGFMLYGPDSLLCGAAAVQVSGEKNGVAVAGLVNGMGSIGPVIQEQVISYLVRDNEVQGMRNTNRLALGMSILFTCLMVVMMWRLKRTHKQNAIALSEAAAEASDSS